MESVTRQDAPEVVRSSNESRGSVLKHTETSHVPKRRATTRKPAFPNSHYTVAMICPLPLEKAAATAMLDEEHQSLRSRREGDDNIYTLGSIHTEQGTHHVVIAGMGRGKIGILPASTVAHHLQQTFPQARLCLVVGIGGGVPSRSHPLRLGDVVVGEKVVPYDAQRVLEGSVVRNGRVLLPPDILLNAASSLEAQHEVSESGIQSILEKKKDQLARFQRPSLEDRLFRPDYLHVSNETDDADGDSDWDPCDSCDSAMVQRRRQRHSTSPSIHIGSIASGGTLLRSSNVRESLGRGELNVLCFEMETAGIMQTLPCLPIRGIADYADSHKNKNWQRYAAATAAAYARELLESITPASPSEEHVAKPRTHTPAESLSVPLKRRQDQFLEALRFDRMDLRRQGIETPQSFTCEWLLEEPHVVKWLDDAQFQEHNGLLLLTGNAGTGKSTCVNYLLDWHKRQRPPDAAAPLFASFFFHNRGVELEKSVIGMYSALLLQLFTGYPDLLDLLNEFSFQTVGSVVGQCPSLQTLQNLFREALLGLNRRSFVCYIDALDEGNVQDVKDMTTFFQNMATDPGVRRNGTFRVMFSSRPYPVVIGRWLGTHFALQDAGGHRCDLERYVLHHLQDAEPIIIKTILQKANGVFLWVKLICRILDDDYLSQGHPCDLKRLRNTPHKLKDLFRDILERDQSNWDEFTVAMTWILYSRRPLSLVEFSAALDLGMEVEQHGSFNLSKITSRNDAMLRKRVVSVSKGLAEVIETGKLTSVQLIHESAQQFLKSGELDHVLRAGRFPSWTICHGRLANYCLRFLQDSTVLEWLESAASSRYKAPPNEIELTVYVAPLGLYHANQSEHCLPPGFVRDFPKQAVGWSQRTSGRLVRIHDWSVMHECAYRGYHALFKYGDWTEQRQVEHINAQTAKYGSPLHLASQRGYLPVVQTLVKWGANIDLRSTKTGRTALAEALSFKHNRVVEWLIAQGANIHIVDSYGQTALHYAARLEAVQVIARLLLACGAEVNQQDNKGLTPLMTAIHGDKPLLARILVDAGATFTEPYSEKEMELVFAVHAGDAESCRSLIRAGANLEIRINNGCTPLWTAAFRGHDAVCQILVDAGADLEAQDNIGQTPLFPAAVYSRHTVCQILADAHANLEAKNYWGETPLMAAAKRGNVLACEILLDHGANVHAADGQGHHVLNIAARKGWREVAQILINYGADVNTPGPTGVTFLMEAALGGDLGIVELLLSSGADISAQNEDGKTVLDMAKGDVLKCLQIWPQNTEGLSPMILDGSDESSS